MAYRRTDQWTNSAATCTIWKDALVRSFQGFSDNHISPDQTKYAEQCILNGGSRHQRYTLIPFENILSDNQVWINIIL